MKNKKMLTDKILIKKIKGRKIIKKKWMQKENTKKAKKNSKLIKLITYSLMLLLLTVAVFSVRIIIFKNIKVNVELIGDTEIKLEVFEEYSDPGIKLIINDKDVSDDISYEGEVNNKKLGSYEVKYLYNDKVYATRIIKVVDTTKPDIKLNGETEIKLVETSNYKELGAIAIDNYDGDLSNNIVVEGNIDTSKTGEYNLTYTVSDSSDNEATINRKIIVIEKPKVIIEKVVTEEKATTPTVPTPVAGFITSMNFTIDGFSIDGCATTGTVPTAISLNDIKYGITNSANNCYTGNIKLSDLTNGTYTLYINSNSAKDKAINNLDPLLQIKRARIGNKLVSFDYTNDNVNINIQDFYYDYDIIIDSGHGGSDVGAKNIYSKEKDMNLIVSTYEKAKYEAAGLKVLMIRIDDSYGLGMGNFSKALYNRAYYMGFYGVTSKVIYSNHHNSSSYAGASGFEMYVSNAMSDMTTEIGIFNAVGEFKKANNISKANNIYARDYWTGNLYSKASGQIYNYKNYYAILKIPSELFNVNNITIYEGCYLSNIDDYIDYWNNENWKEISDIKVEYYINKIKG